MVGSVSLWRRLLASLEPSAMTGRHLYYCGHPHCRGHPPAWGGFQNSLGGGGVLAQGLGIWGGGVPSACTALRTTVC